MKIINGDLIAMAKDGKFDVIAHGCNCFNTQGAGIALQMSQTFYTHEAFLEQAYSYGEIDKLGRIEPITVPTGDQGQYRLTVVNAYTQFKPGRNLDLEALTLVLRKINYEYKGKRVGLPLIGGGIAGGDKETIIKIMESELKDVDLTLVLYNQDK